MRISPSLCQSPPHNKAVLANNTLSGICMFCRAKKNKNTYRAIVESTENTVTLLERSGCEHPVKAK